MNQKQLLFLFKQKAIRCVAFCSVMALCNSAPAQTTLSLTDLSSFQNPGSNWHIAGDITADLDKNGQFYTSRGTGILVNLPEQKEQSKDLFANFQHGDLELELDFMMAKGSNSGIYLQGRYEIQLFDSWGVKNPQPGDNGGIYERWDESRGKNQQGYEGHAPRQNVSRAPGLWQHLKISFQAPRFNSIGTKIQNAKMLRVELNGVLLHENVELSGPTRGALGNNEVALGPLRIQGDHGPVAFRNVMYKNYDKPRPELTNLTYKIYKGKFEKEPDFSKLPPEAQGTSILLTSAINKIDNEFLIRYSGILNVKEAGEYSFNLNAPGGGGGLKINNQMVMQMGQRGNGKITLPSGKFPFELLYSKFVSWTKPALGLAVTGPGIREYLVSDENTSVNEVVDPILMGALENTTLRSFVDIPGGQRIVHAINVGSPHQIHYSYDLDKGALFQVWRGGFLDATPMWHSRGDGSSRADGSVLFLGNPAFIFQSLNTPDDPWNVDTTGSGYRPKGYVLEADNCPRFKYFIYGASVTDAIRVLDNGQGLQREISLQNAPANLYARIAAGSVIEMGANGFYLVDGKSYYLSFKDADGAKPFIRDNNGRKELVVPVKTKLSYSLIF